MSELVHLFREAQHSRLPVYRETLDDPTGLVHVKDVLALLQDAPGGGYRLPQVPITGLRRPILFVPPSMRALDLLLKMQTSHTHLSLVIDEYGGTDGLVSIEDIIEQIVGDIADEHDEEGPSRCAATAMPLLPMCAAGAGGFQRPDRVERNWRRPRTRTASTPWAGWWFRCWAVVPQRGEIVEAPAGFVFEVLEADPRRIKELRIRPPRTDGVT